MKRLFFLLALALSCTVLTQAKTVNLVDYGAVADDAVADDAAMTAAVNDLKQAGGGTIVFPSGKVILREQQAFAQFDKFTNFRLEGDKKSVIEVAGAWLLFNFGNTLQVEIEGLTFVGRNVQPGHPNFTDVSLAVIYSPSGNQLSIKKTQFLGLRSNDSIVKVGNGDLHLEDVQFDGNSAQIANIHVFGPYQRGLTIRNGTFGDYANWQNQFLSKSPYGNGSWIRVEGAAAPVSASGLRQVRIEDCRFDEAAQTGVYIADVFAAHLSGLAFNVSGVSNGRGVTLNNVEYAAVKGSWFGWTTNARPAIVALNNTTVEATAIKTGGGVFLGNFDSSSRIDTQFCNNCLARPIQ